MKQGSFFNLMLTLGSSANQIAANNLCMCIGYFSTVVRGILYAFKIN